MYPRFLLSVLAACTLSGGAFITTKARAATCPGLEQPAASTGDTQWSNSVVCLINQERVKYHRRPLHKILALRRGAQNYSQTMVSQHIFSHNNIEARFQNSGYLRGMSLWGMGENILWSGSPGLAPQDAVRLWLASPHHRANLLSSAWYDTGVGISQYSPAGNYGWTAVQWFGQRFS